jgi:hypothetical protein
MAQHTLILPEGTGYFETDKFPIGGSFHRAAADMVIKVKETIEFYRGCDTIGITEDGREIAFNSQYCK